MSAMINRRAFFKTSMAGVAGYFMSPLELLAQSSVVAQPDVGLQGKAKNVIFILLAGAPSQVDTFDLKIGPWTPADFDPTTIDGIDFPQGLLPGMAQQLNRVAVVRSMQTLALVHPLLQNWTQIARNPTSATGGIAPNMGSIVALETEAQRRSDQPLPGFVSLNTGGRVSQQGYFEGRYSPFDLVADPEGLNNTSNAAGEQLFSARYEMLQLLDSVNRQRSQYGPVMDELHDFYTSTRRMMYEPRVNEAFQFSSEEAERYGGSNFGNSCVVARNLISGDLGTRYIQINSRGWDNHQDIYREDAGLYARCAELDPALSSLLTDLANTPGSSGNTLVDETLIVVKGRVWKDGWRTHQPEWSGSLLRPLCPLRRRRHCRGADHRRDHLGRPLRSGSRMVCRTARHGGRHRRHDLFDHGDQLHDRASRRPAGSRLPLRALHSLAGLPDRRAIRVARLRHRKECRRKSTRRSPSASRKEDNRRQSNRPDRSFRSGRGSGSRQGGPGEQGRNRPSAIWPRRRRITHALLRLKSCCFFLAKGGREYYTVTRMCVWIAPTTDC